MSSSFFSPALMVPALQETQVQDHMENDITGSYMENDIEMFHKIILFQ